MSLSIHKSSRFTVCTVFTWLNTVATIKHVLKFDVATIQGWPPCEGRHLLHLHT